MIADASRSLRLASVLVVAVALAACAGDDSSDGSASTSAGTTNGTGTSAGTSEGTTSEGTSAGSSAGSSAGTSAGTTSAGTSAGTTSAGTTSAGTTMSTTSETDGTTSGVDPCEPALPTFADGLTPTATLHVAGGAAPGGDGSEAKPFDNLQTALQAATPGTEVRVSGSLPAGAYTTGLAGAPGAPIWIRGEPGASIGPLTLESARDIVLEDLELSSGTGHVLHFFFAERLLFRRLKIHDAGLGCIKGSQTYDAFVEDVDLWAAGQQSDHPVLDYVGVNGGHIVRSRFHQGPGVMVMLKGGTSDLLFAFNEIFDQTAPGNALALGQSTGPQFFQPIDAPFEGLRIIAYANRLHDLVGPPVAFEGCKDCAAVHNTIWATTGAQLVRFLPGAAGQDSGVTTSIPEGNRFSGNIVVGGQDNGASLNADMENTGPGNVIDYNVFLKPGALNWWGVIEQELVHSTYDQDPQVGADGTPANVALVDGMGPPDLDGLPFADAFTRDAFGACVSSPRDIGAIEVP